MSRFIQYNRTHQYLLPPSVDEWLPERHMARFVINVLDQLKLSKLTRRYSMKSSGAYIIRQ